MWEVGKIWQKLNVWEIAVSEIPIFEMMPKKLVGTSKALIINSIIS
jgi:hypothetical protein